MADEEAAAAAPAEDAPAATEGQDTPGDDGHQVAFQEPTADNGDQQAVVAPEGEAVADAAEAEKEQEIQEEEVVQAVIEKEDVVEEETYPKSQMSMLSGRQSYIQDKRKSMEKKKTQAMGSIISIRKGTADGFDRQKIPRFMNSYRLDSNNPFNSEKVAKILKEVLKEAMDDLTYDTDKIIKRAKWAVGAIRGKVKILEFERYKIVCMVTLGEKRSQDVLTMFRFLWDLERDKYAQYVRETMNIYGFALCFGTYYE